MGRVSSWLPLAVYCKTAALGWGAGGDIKVL
jgi:hypothetical protein